MYACGPERKNMFELLHATGESELHILLLVLVGEGEKVPFF